MVEYKPGLEYTGWRYALAWVREVWHRWRLTRKLIIAVIILVPLLAANVICDLAGRHTGTRHVARYCTQCGFVETEDQILVCGFVVPGKVRASGTFLSRWLEERQHHCTAHHWVSGNGSGVDYICALERVWDGCVPNHIFQYRLEYSLPGAPYEHEVIGYERVLTTLADVDESLALQLASGLLIPEDAAHWQWLKQQSEAGWSAPEALAESFRQFERDHPHGSEQN